MKLKKKLSLLLLALAACVGLSSCGDDDKDGLTESVIVGEWNSEFLGEMDYDDVAKLDLNDKTIHDDYTGFGYTYFKFNSDGTGYDIYYSGDRTDWKWQIIDGIIYESDGQKYQIVKYNMDVIYLLRLSSYEAGIKLVRRKK